MGKPPLIAAIMKLEELYIIEWVAWHKLQGFDIVIADNCTAGPQTDLLRRLDAAGIIKRIEFIGVPQPQMPAYRMLYWYALRNGYRIIGYLDADEFFEPLTDVWSGAALVKRALRPITVTSLRACWAQFGSNEREVYENELVTVRFTKRGGVRAAETKTFFKVMALLHRAVRKPASFMDHPHYPPLSTRMAIQDGRKPRGTLSYDEWVDCRIRHYAVKSRAEYLTKRNVRGDVFYGMPKNISVYLKSNDLNDVADPLPDSVINDLRHKIKEITAML